MEVIRAVEARFLSPGDQVVYKRVSQESQEEGVHTYTKTVQRVDFLSAEPICAVCFEEEKDPEHQLLLNITAELEIKFDWTWAFYQLSCEWSHLRQLNYVDFIEELRDYPWSDQGCVVQQIKSDMELSKFHSELLDHLECGGRYCPSCVTILKEELDYQHLIQRF